MSELAQLIGQAGPPISRAPQRLREVPVTLARPRRIELEALLHLRDGFVALGGALVVRPSVTVSQVRGVDDWNMLTLWRTPYGRSSELYFFAEDRYGLQFALYKDEVVAFDPVDGAHQHIGFGLDGWAAYVTSDDDVLHRERLQEWVDEHGALGPHQRLQPRIPLSFQPPEDALFTEWRVLDDVELMRRYARLYKATREHPGVLPEGFDEWWWGEGKA